MTQALPDTQRINPIQAELSALGRRRRTYAFGAGAVRAAWIGGLIGFVLVIVDAVIALPGNIRLAGLIAIALVLLVGILVSIHWRDTAARETLHDARAIERKYRLWSNPLVNALLLANIADREGDDLQQQLARRSVERGKSALEQIDVQTVIDREALRREAGWLWAVLVMWLVLLLIHPRLITGGLQRMAAPFGTTEPFSLTEIDIEVNPDEVFVGDDATVTANVTGRVPDTAEFVQLDENGQAAQRWPMQLATPDDADDRAFAFTPSAAFERHLYELREPITFRVEAGDARSKTVTITPKPRPTGDDQPESEPDDATAESGETGEQDAQSGESESGGDEGGQGETGPSLAEMFPEFFEKLGELGGKAGPLAERAQELRDTKPPDTTSPPGQDWQEKFDQLQRDVQDFQGEARELAGEARRLAEENPPQREPLEGIAEQLDALSLLELGDPADAGAARPGTLPGQGAQPGQNLGQAPGDMPGQSPGDATNQSPSTQPGIGQGGREGEGAGGHNDNGHTGQWLGEAQRAGESDRESLEQLARQLRDVLAREPREDQKAEDWPVGTPDSVYRESVDAAGDFAPPDAVMQQVPPEYRQLMRQYYDRLNRDAIGSNEP